MHGTQARRVRQAGVRNNSTHTHTHTHTHADIRNRRAGRQAGREVGAPGRAQRMSSGPMLDARHAGQAGETGRQARRACATAHTRAANQRARTALTNEKKPFFPSTPRARIRRVRFLPFSVIAEMEKQPNGAMVSD